MWLCSFCGDGSRNGFVACPKAGDAIRAEIDGDCQLSEGNGPFLSLGSGIKAATFYG